MQPTRNIPVLYIFFGLIASGKSTLAERFADRYGFAYWNTDRVRKELVGVDPVSRQADSFNQGIYTEAFTRKTYQKMLNLAAEYISSGGEGVVLDGSYASRNERAHVLELSRRLGAESVFILCQCGESTVRTRLELRARDPQAVSDGRWEIYMAQKEHFQAPSELEPGRLLTVQTELPVDMLLKNLAAELDLQ